MFGPRMYFLAKRSHYPLPHVERTKIWDSDLTNEAQGLFPCVEMVFVNLVSWTSRLISLLVFCPHLY